MCGLGRIRILKDVHILISQTCQNANLYDKKVFAELIKLMTLRWEDYSVLSHWGQCNQKNHYKKDAGVSE